MQIPRGYSLFLTGLIFIVAGTLLLYWDDPPAPIDPMSSSTASGVTGGAPHVAGDPNISIVQVSMRIYYFVPKDRQDQIRPTWAEDMRTVLEQMRAFHRLQFKGNSSLEFEIIPELVVGLEDGAFYDGNDTARGNPHAWISIRQEMDERSGHLAPQERDFSVRFVLYEGVGALGGQDQILVSSGFLDTDYTASTFYHELGHTFGLEDAYEYDNGAPLDEDIMGLGRTRPIGQAYLSDAAKRELGIQ